MESTVRLNRHEYMPGWAFKLMVLTMRFRDLFKAPSNKLNNFGISSGDILIDYGCGPGRYLKKASKLVGPKGKVYAVDIHEIAMNCIIKLKKKRHLDNVYPTKADHYFVPIQENKADLIYVLDVFHMISNSNEFLNELHRLIKPKGRLILEDGHQKRSVTKDKILSNGRWRINTENKKHLELKAKYKTILSI